MQWVFLVADDCMVVFSALLINEAYRDGILITPLTKKKNNSYMYEGSSVVGPKTKTSNHSCSKEFILTPWLQ